MQNERQTPETIVQSNGDICVKRFEPNAMVSIVTGIFCLVLSGTFIAFGEAFKGLGLLAMLLPVSLCMAFLQHKLTVSNGVVTQVWSFGKREFTSTFEPGHFARVSFGTFRSDKTVHHRALLQNDDKTKQVVLCSATSVKEARRFAEVFAKALQLPICDLNASGRERNFDEVDKNIAETEEVTELPSTPNDLRSDIQFDEGSLVITVPGPEAVTSAKRFRCLSYLFLFGPVCLILGIALLWQWKEGISLASLAIPFGILGMVLAVSELIARKLANDCSRRSVRISIDQQQLSVDGTDLFGKPIAAIMPLSELEELFHNITPRVREMSEFAAMFEFRSSIVARSDNETHACASWLSNEEKDYLCVLMRQLIARVAVPSTTHTESQQEPVLV